MTRQDFKMIRDRLGMSQQKISELLGIKETMWSRWENERKHPGYKWSAIIGALGMIVQDCDIQKVNEFSVMMKTRHAMLDSPGVRELIVSTYASILRREE